MVIKQVAFHQRCLFLWIAQGYTQRQVILPHITLKSQPDSIALLLVHRSYQIGILFQLNHQQFILSVLIQVLQDIPQCGRRYPRQVICKEGILRLHQVALIVLPSQTIQLFCILLQRLRRLPLSRRRGIPLLLFYPKHCAQHSAELVCVGASKGGDAAQQDDSCDSRYHLSSFMFHIHPPLLSRLPPVPFQRPLA